MRRHDHDIETDDDFLSFCFGLAVLAISRDLSVQLAEMEHRMTLQLDAIQTAANEAATAAQNAVDILNTPATGSDPAADAANQAIVDTVTGQLNTSSAALQAAVDAAKAAHTPPATTPPVTTPPVTTPPVTVPPATNFVEKVAGEAYTDFQARVTAWNAVPANANNLAVDPGVDAWNAEPVG